MKRKHVVAFAITGILGAVLVLSAAPHSQAKSIRYRKEFKEKRYLVEDVVNQKIDKNNDGILSKKERNAVTSFTVGTGMYHSSDNVVIALDDLACFPNLREVVFSQRVSSLKPLYSLKKIESLVIPSRSVVYKKSIRFDKFPNLKKLEVSVKGITVNLKKNKKLQELDCASCDLKKLDLSNNRRLTKVICNGNKLTEILFHKEANIKSLDCSMNRIRKLTNLKAESLEELNCSSNCLRTLELGQARNLKQATIDSNEFVSVDVRNCTKLKMLSAQKNTKVFKLYLPQIQISQLFVDEMCQVEKSS